MIATRGQFRMAAHEAEQRHVHNSVVYMLPQIFTALEANGL
jgi:hypothetical protein